VAAKTSCVNVECATLRRGWRAEARGGPRRDRTLRARHAAEQAARGNRQRQWPRGGRQRQRVPLTLRYALWSMRVWSPRLWPIGGRSKIEAAISGQQMSARQAAPYLHDRHAPDTPTRGGFRCLQHLHLRPTRCLCLAAVTARDRRLRL